MLKGKTKKKRRRQSSIFFCFYSEDEISLNKGIWVNVLQKKNDGWWFVQYEKQRGWFPSNYLIEVKSDLFFFCFCSIKI